MTYQTELETVLQACILRGQMRKQLHLQVGSIPVRAILARR